MHTMFIVRHVHSHLHMCKPDHEARHGAHAIQDLLILVTIVDLKVGEHVCR
jgi:hypothetical protein